MFTITKKDLIKILNAENLNEDQKADLILLLQTNGDLIASLVETNVTVSFKNPKGRTISKTKAKGKTKGKAKGVNGTDVIRDFFKRNKGKQISIPDIASKTGLGNKFVQSTVYRLYKHGELKSKTAGIYYL